MTSFHSSVFPVKPFELPGGSESIVKGGRGMFPLLSKALDGVRQIGVLGWGPQGRAQALNLRDSLAGTEVRVAVGLRPGSSSFAAASREGFSATDGTLGDWLEIAAASDFVLVLISDAAQAKHYPEIFAALRPSTTLGLSHGFLLGHLQSVGEEFPADIGVVAVCPKGMGDSVRRLYVQHSGINASFAVHQDVDGRAVERALAWSVALGSPYTFQTTLEAEYRSDIAGERAILLGAVHGIVESLYQRYRLAGVASEDAFERSCESITGPISRTISHEGIVAVRKALTSEDQAVFDRAYAATYPVARDLIVEIYDEVASGNELRSVVLAGQRLADHPLTPIANSPMWTHGAVVRARRETTETAIDPFTAGIFVGTMMAQIDVLAGYSHPWSEIANESVIEAVDSLLPYMHARGVDYMVDNCSVTARLGTRKWGPRFQAVLDQIVYPSVDNESTVDIEMDAFHAHPIHEVLATVATLRPPVDIAVS